MSNKVLVFMSVTQTPQIFVGTLENINLCYKCVFRAKYFKKLSLEMKFEFHSNV